MSLFQRMITAIVPSSFAEKMEAESRKWMARCHNCGAERSIWELGGIRYGATGKTVTRLRCGPCGKNTRHDLHYKAA